MYIPLAEDYRLSAKNHYSIARVIEAHFRDIRKISPPSRLSPMITQCNNIIKALVDKNENQLKLWAFSNKYNMLHLVRFLRITNSDYYDLSIIGINEDCIRSFNAFDTKTQDPQLTIDGKHKLIINDVELHIDDIGTKRDDFINICPIDFEIGDMYFNNVLYMFLLNDIPIDYLSAIQNFGITSFDNLKHEGFREAIRRNGYGNSSISYFSQNIMPTVKDKFSLFISENKKLL